MVKSVTTEGFLGKINLKQRNKFIQRYFVGDIIPLSVAFESFQPLKAFIASLLCNQIYHITLKCEVTIPQYSKEVIITD